MLASIQNALRSLQSKNQSLKAELNDLREYDSASGTFTYEVVETL